MAVAEDFTIEEKEEQERMVLESVDRFLERDVEPFAHDLEADDTYPQEIVDKMVDMGLFGATIGMEYGGLGLSVSTYAKIVERVSTVWMSVSGIFNSVSYTHLTLPTKA